MFFSERLMKFMYGFFRVRINVLMFLVSSGPCGFFILLYRYYSSFYLVRFNQVLTVFTIYNFNRLFM